jgi:hypothetical protein
MNAAFVHSEWFIWSSQLLLAGEYHAKKSKSAVADKADWSHNGALKGSRMGGDASAKAKADMDRHHDSAFEDPNDPDADELQKRYKLFSDEAKLQRSAVGQAFLVMFLCYPGVTSKIFGLFVCYDVSNESVVSDGVEYVQSPTQTSITIQSSSQSQSLQKCQNVSRIVLCYY